MEVRLCIQNPVIPYPSCFEADIFSRPEHLGSQTQEDFYSFYLYNQRTYQALAAIHLVCGRDADYHAPARAPFGGLDCSEDYDTEAIAFLLFCVDDWISEKQGKSITLKTAPSCYHPDLSQRLAQSYAQAGYQVIQSDLNLHIEVNRHPFVRTIAPAEHRRLKKCKKAGFIITEERTGLPESVFQFLEESYASKGYPLSISQAQFKNLLILFPDEFRIFTLRNNAEIIALCVTVRVNRNALYSFLPADLVSYKQFSPMVLLYEEIYQYCQHQGISLLDLGISLDHHGIIKPGLVLFKKNIGGKESAKTTYRKSYVKH